MPRGRPRKSAPPKAAVVASKPKAVSKPDAISYDCSACDFKSANTKTTQNHIFRVHYGQVFLLFFILVLHNHYTFFCRQARINDSKPLSDNERITAFINAQKLLKVLKCSLCGKGFRSGLGYKFHQDICGKDVSIIELNCFYNLTNQ